MIEHDEIIYEVGDRLKNTAGYFCTITELVDVSGRIIKVDYDQGNHNVLCEIGDYKNPLSMMTEKCWRIKENYPIEVFHKTNWLGKKILVTVPKMTMTYDTYKKLQDSEGFSTGSYNYFNGKCDFCFVTEKQVLNWLEKHKDIIKTPEEDING